jgi:hypothetical protein
MTTHRLLGLIAKQLLKSISKLRKQTVVDFAAFSAGKRHAEASQANVISAKRLAELHPLHARYVAVQNQVSVMSEQLIVLPQLARLSKVLTDAEDMYLPSGPPMSPLTSSHFFFWSTFDAAVGTHKETLGTCLIALLKRLGSDPEFVRLVEIMQGSRMGLYLHLRVEGKCVWLRDLVTGLDVSCLVPAGYLGRPDEVWLARVLPPPSAEFRDSIVITTPYIIVRPRAPGWYAFLERTLPKLKCSTPYEAYDRLMKYGLSLNYWNEYIFEAYAGAETSAIFLRGLPDIDLSRPHSRQTEALLNGAHGVESRDEGD